MELKAQDVLAYYGGVDQLAKSYLGGLDITSHDFHIVGTSYNVKGIERLKLRVKVLECALQLERDGWKPQEL